MTVLLEMTLRTIPTLLLLESIVSVAAAAHTAALGVGCSSGGGTKQGRRSISAATAVIPHFVVTTVVILVVEGREDMPNLLN